MSNPEDHFRREPYQEDGSCSLPEEFKIIPKGEKGIAPLQILSAFWQRTLPHVAGRVPISIEGNAQRWRKDLSSIASYIPDQSMTEEHVPGMEEVVSRNTFENLPGLTELRKLYGSITSKIDRSSLDTYGIVKVVQTPDGWKGITQLLQESTGGELLTINLSRIAGSLKLEESEGEQLQIKYRPPYPIPMERAFIAENLQIAYDAPQALGRLSASFDLFISAPGTRGTMEGETGRLVANYEDTTKKVSLYAGFTEDPDAYVQERNAQLVLRNPIPRYF